MPDNNIDPNAATVDAVLGEIKALGDNSKASYNELRKQYEELKKIVDENSKDVLAKENLDKIATDIAVRQDELDTKHAKSELDSTTRMDSIEVALQRLPRSSGVDSEKGYEDAKSFYISALASQRQNDSGISPEDVEGLNVSLEAYNDYRKSFDGYCRKFGGDQRRHMPEPQLKALQVGIASDGGVTVPVAMSSRVQRKLFETDPMRQLASSETISTGSLEFMAEIDQAGFSWEGESTGETTLPGESSTPGWQMIKIPVHSAIARPRATQTLLEDSSINIESWLANKIADRFARGEAAAFITGTGAGMPKGILSYTSGTSFQNVEQIEMGHATALTADGFVDVKYALQEYYLERGTWLMNRTTLQACMKLKDGQGNYLWKPSMIANDPSSAILNLPVRMSTTMPTIAANSLSVALGDWKEAYLIVDRLGITVLRNPYSFLPFIEFYTRKRVGGGLANGDALKIGKIAA